MPVVYLAQASGRLGPTGALIAGNDLSLIAGKNLDNVGTLKASNDLSASAGGDLVNNGLVEAGNRLPSSVSNGRARCRVAVAATAPLTVGPATPSDGQHRRDVVGAVACSY